MRRILMFFAGALMSIAPAAAMELTNVYVDGKAVLHVPFGSANLTPGQFAQQIQRRLDGALMVSTDQPAMVIVRPSQGGADVCLNNQVVVTLTDAMTAPLHQTSAQLAADWARGLQTALDGELNSNKVSYVSGERTLSALIPGTTDLSTAPQRQMRFVRLPAGMVLNVELENDVHTSALRPGDGVVAHTVADIVLPSGEVLAHGTRFFGDLTATSPQNMFGPAPLRLQFDRMQLATGAQFPISASVMMGSTPVDSWVISPGPDRAYPAGLPLVLELTTPAQIAVTGTTF